MSQKVRIDSVKVEGSPYVGVRYGVDRWTRTPDEIMNWLCDGWRGLYNNFRAQRLVEGSEVLTQSQYRASASYRSALPTSVLQGTERLEASDWFAALKRIKNASSGRKGRAPRFKRLKDGRSMVVRGSGYTEVRRLSRSRGELVITGKNPSGMYGPSETLRWSVRVRFRWSQDIRPFTSVRVDWDRRAMAFVNEPVPVQRTGDGAVGLDLGVTRTVATSDREFLSIPKATSDEEARYRALQRKLSRQDRVNEARGGRAGKFASNRRRRTLAQMRSIARKQARRREDWAQKASTDLVRRYGTIVIEDLSAARLSRAGGARKRGLNRSILASSWGRLQSCLQYKAELAGVDLIRVNPAYTSQTCNECGHIARESRESQAAFLCVKCGHATNADINAAMNIRDIGLGRSLGRGGEVRPETATVAEGAAGEASTLVLAVSA